MSALKKYFNKGIVQDSLVQTDYDRVVKIDELGNEFITWLPVDYEAIQKSNGTVDLWSLNNLLKAGINPDFPIHTGFNARIEGIDTVAGMTRTVEEILAPDPEENE